MKNIVKYLVLLVLIPKMGFAVNPEKHAYNKEKTISKTFDVNSDVQLGVVNSYGNVNVYLWDENKVSIQVNIKVSGNNEAKVNQRIDDIDVSFQASQSRVNAETEFGNSKWHGNNNLSYEINYIVKIPKNGSADLDNKYGGISVEKLNGTAIIRCQYGSINLGQLNGKSNTINISYSHNSTINTSDKINLKSQYSDVEFQKVNLINIDGNYNNFEFQNLGTINVSSNYTKIKSNATQKVAIDGNYLTLKLGEIGNTLNISSNYSDVQFSTSNSTKNIIVNGNYSNTKIFCSTDYAFDFNINLGYGSLKDGIGLKYIEKSEKNNSKSYSGYNISSGKSKLSVTTNYGGVQLINK